jgi:lysozyme
VTQAMRFSAATENYHGTLLPMVDVEASSVSVAPSTSAVRIEQLSYFLQTIEKTIPGKRCIIYTGYSFWNDVMGGTDAFAGHPLWVAAYGPTYNPAPVPAGFKDALLWQHSSSGQIDGINSGVDLDILYSDSLEIISR